MNRYARYDATENHIFVDLSNMTVNYEVLSRSFDEVVAIAKSLPDKVYVLACWNNTELDTGILEIYGDSTESLFQYVRGIVRYGRLNSVTSVTIRAQTVKRKLQGLRSHIYPTKEEALQKIRLLENETSH
jgi:hypothetical protein